MRTSLKLTHFTLLVLASILGSCLVFAQPNESTVQVSDQKAGSLLVFPFYGSDGTQTNDTRITISNVGPSGVNPATSIGAVSNSLNVHLFWLDGASCSQADGYICFTKYQQWVLKASDWDPVTARGILIAVAVDAMGYPIAYNGLIGNAFVNCNVAQGFATERWLGNYGAEAFVGVGVPVQAPGLPGMIYTDPGAVAQAGSTASLFFTNAPRNGGNGYDAGANSFAAEFQSPADSVGQTILTVGLGGTIGGALTGAGVDNNRIGALYRADEKLFSWTGPLDACQLLIRISTTNPRVLGGLGVQVPTGKSGTFVWSTNGGSVGLFITPNSGNNAFVGIRGLHKRDVTRSLLVMPVFMPVCVV